MLTNTHNARVSDGYWRHRNHAYIFLVLFFLLISRWVSMYLIPLNDPTEARYAEIARLMLQTGNWVTPMHHLGEPFWAKPPLSSWLSAISMQFLGVSAWVARLPSLLLSIVILGMIWDLAKRYRRRDIALIAVLILAGSVYFFLDAGTVMTDPALLFCVTLTLIAFAHAVIFGDSGEKSPLSQNAMGPFSQGLTTGYSGLAKYQSVWGYIFFVGLGLGLLAKGPIATALCSMPIFFWVLWHRKWALIWRQLPWLKGGLLMLLITVPWYWLAEERTPGFLHYFIVGEHISRFLQPGWSGDKYGFVHVAPMGMIWIYALLGIFPWTFLSLFWGVKYRRLLPVMMREDTRGWLSYLVLCTFIPLIFFTFARNIIYPYVFPCLPTFALLFAEVSARANTHLLERRWFLPSVAINGFIFLIGSMLFVFKPAWIAKSQDRVISAWCKDDSRLKSHLIYWSNKTEYSALFYSGGRAKSTLDSQQLDHYLSRSKKNYIVINSVEGQSFPKELMPRLTKISNIQSNHKQYVVYRVNKLH